VSESKKWKPWSADDDATLRAIYADLTISAPAKTAAERLKRSIAAVSVRASKFQITRAQRAQAARREQMPPLAQPVIQRWQPRPKRALETVPDFLRDSFTEFARRRPAS